MALRDHPIVTLSAEVASLRAENEKMRDALKDMIGMSEQGTAMFEAIRRNAEYAIGVMPSGEE